MLNYPQKGEICDNIGLLKFACAHHLGEALCTGPTQIVLHCLGHSQFQSDDPAPQAMKGF